MPTVVRHNYRALKWVLGGLLLAMVALGAAIFVAWRHAEPVLRAEVVKQIQDRFHARVELDKFQLSLAHGLSVEGKGLRIWPSQPEGAQAANLPNQWPQIRPLIQLDEFRFRAPLHWRPGAPIRIPLLALKGLHIDIPPKDQFARRFSREPGEESHSPAVRFEVDNIACTDAHLTIETDKPGKLPLEFTIVHLKLTDRHADGSMQYNAQLTNPRPAGEIFTTGRIGPWTVEDPGQTPLDGSYRFEHADLGVFKGIAGILHSTGKYQGILRNLTVDGETDTPDFRLTKFGTAMPLHTAFHAYVDGTNGDTDLEPVNAMLGQTSFVAEGKVVHVPPGTAPNGKPTPGGHNIALHVTVNGGHMEDFLRLTSKTGTPLLTGTVMVKAFLEIPPGPAPVDEKLKLKGNFMLTDTQFTSPKIQEKLCDLSWRGQGKSEGAKQNEIADVSSSMKSDFTMARAVITLPDLQYTVPGAEIDLAGTYGVRGGVLNFNGTARTDATISQMVGGWKGDLLKPADRFFKKGGAGAEVPIRVAGTRDDPKFGIDLGRFKHTSPQIP
ncbi:MAG: hypothetical protein WBP85_10370 [Terracidiphilus sp.]